LTDYVAYSCNLWLGIWVIGVEMENSLLITAILVVGLALFFDFTNGFHDSANVIASMVSSRALSPREAVVLASFFEFLGAYLLGTAVALTIGKGIVDPQIIKAIPQGILVVFAALTSAVVWNLITWYFGFPSSSSHALIGGLLGAFIIVKGFEIVHWVKVGEIFLVMFASPFLGLVLNFLFTRLVSFFSQWFTPKINNFFKRMQIISSICLALSHGTNDAQKTMGVITLSLIVLKVYQPSSIMVIPKWVMAACALALSLGIASGGWRVVKTLGSKLYRLQPIHGFTSQTTSAFIIYTTAFFGFPISTTQVVSSSIMGAGTAFRPKAVRWELFRNILATWLVTIPATALLSSGSYLILRRFFS